MNEDELIVDEIVTSTRKDWILIDNKWCNNHEKTKEECSPGTSP